MSDTAKPVVVGVDGTTEATAAARWAAAVADKFSAPLQIVHGTPDAGHLLTEAAAAIGAAAIAEHRESAEAILKSVEEELRAEFDGLPIFTTRYDERADRVLTELSHHARLIVLGSEEVTPTAALLIGSTTVAVAAHSACPVVAWRGCNATPTDRSIVLGVDDVGTGAAAFTAAFEFADRFGVGIKAIHSWSAFRPLTRVTNPYLIDWDGLEAAQWQRLLDTLAPWTELYPDVKVTYFVEPEGASKALLHHVADSQLVVVGNRGRNILTGALLGSTSLNLLHHSPVPVMLCHTRPDSH
jgi:nucleotide-binding universal stress UspA family protein